MKAALAGHKGARGEDKFAPTSYILETPTICKPKNLHFLSVYENDVQFLCEGEAGRTPTRTGCRGKSHPFSPASLRTLERHLLNSADLEQQAVFHLPSTATPLETKVVFEKLTRKFKALEALGHLSGFTLALEFAHDGHPHIHLGLPDTLEQAQQVALLRYWVKALSKLPSTSTQPSTQPLEHPNTFQAVQDSKAVKLYLLKRGGTHAFKRSYSHRLPGPEWDSIGQTWCVSGSLRRPQPHTFTVQDISDMLEGNGLTELEATFHAPLVLEKVRVILGASHTKRRAPYPRLGPSPLELNPDGKVSVWLRGAAEEAREALLEAIEETVREVLEGRKDSDNLTRFASVQLAQPATELLEGLDNRPLVIKRKADLLEGLDKTRDEGRSPALITMFVSAHHLEHPHCCHLRGVVGNPFTMTPLEEQGVNQGCESGNFRIHSPSSRLPPPHSPRRTHRLPPVSRSCPFIPFTNSSSARTGTRYLRPTRAARSFPLFINPTVLNLDKPSVLAASSSERTSRVLEV
jgi:hypothetical protein